ncbi:Uncharacterised protein [Mycobacteroides abscessus subsp. abscessus]|nr:Uncharacterised protein [Mycobacteroides abscessus subsp. abscessus]
MGLAARRDGSRGVDNDIIGYRTRENSAENPVADREVGHSVTDLVDYAGVVGAEPARQAQPEPGGGVRIRRHEPVHWV